MTKSWVDEQLEDPKVREKFIREFAKEEAISFGEWLYTYLFYLETDDDTKTVTELYAEWKDSNG